MLRWHDVWISGITSLGRASLGGDRFIVWVKDTVLKRELHRGYPSLKEISSYRAGDVVAKVIARDMGKRIEKVRAKKGLVRQIAMELLYRAVDLRGREIGRTMGVGYTSINQERRRQENRKLRTLLNGLEAKCHK